MSIFEQHPAAAAAHLGADEWEQASRHLVRKAIAEYAHELLVLPVAAGAAAQPGRQRFELADPSGAARYRFEARTMALRHWRIDAASITKTMDGQPAPLDALRFVIEFKQALGIRPEMLPVYLEEISSTLYGAAYKRRKRGPSSAELVDADFQLIEQSMTEGHPGFVANNGRLGFDAADYPAYAPEAGARFPIVWLAVHTSCASFACAADLSYERLVSEEVGPRNLERFTRTLLQAGVSPHDYLMMPAHPWQWFNKLAIGFAADIAERRIICLGYSEDRYQAQQSIRTFFNVSNPQRRYVKTSLSILNMGFMRGLSPYYMSGTPAINDWVKALVESDATLRGLGFSILREVASIGFRNGHVEAAIEGDSPYKKMLSALWRESPVPLIGPNERLMTMTALLHVDHRGDALLPALIDRSGRGTAGWLRAWLRAYFAPLLHCFYAHDLVFMPHGENLIMVLDDDRVPVRVIMKDIAEECAILNKRAVLPERVQRIAVDVPDDYKLLGIFIDVFDGFFRHVSQVLVEHGCCSEDEFWSQVAGCAIDYQQAHPQYRDKFAAFDLFCDEFRHSCLNRLQLGNNTQMVNLADPAAGLKMAGCLPNPLARFRPDR
jgi:siderophore synthetase component